MLLFFVVYSERGRRRTRNYTLIWSGLTLELAAPTKLLTCAVCMNAHAHTCTYVHTHTHTHIHPVHVAHLTLVHSCIVSAWKEIIHERTWRDPRR